MKYILALLCLSALAGEMEEKKEDGTVHKFTVNAAGDKDGMYRVFDGAKKLLVEQTWRSGRLLYPKSQKLIAQKIAEFEAEAKKVTSANPVKTATGVLAPSLKDQAAILAQMKIYRYLCDVSPDIEMGDEQIEMAQCAVEVLNKAKVLSHAPNRPEGVSDEVFEKGLKGCELSNLGAGNPFADYVANNVKDSSPSIVRVANRRWILSPVMKTTGFGMKASYMAHFVQNFDGEAPDMPGVCFPPRGYCPIKLFGDGTAWHFSPLPLKEEINETCTATVYPVDANLKRGAAITNSYHKVDATTAIARSSAIIWKPKITIKPGMSFEVEIVGVRAEPIVYIVTFY